MNGKDFIARLKRAKSELLSLKQSSNIGLGLASFYTEETSIEFTPDYSGSVAYVYVKFDESIEGVPFVQLYLSNAETYSITDVEWDGSTKTMTYELYCFLSSVTVDLTVEAVSSEIISSLEVEYAG